MQPSVTARVQKVMSPVALPGCCAVCSRPTCEEGFADPNLNIEWHGAFYFCATCVAEMAALWDYISPEQYADFQRINAEQAELLAELRTSVDSLEKQIDSLSYDRLVSRGLLSLPANAVDDSADVPSEPAISEPVESVTDAADKLLAELAEPRAKKGANSSKSTAKQRPNDAGESTDSNGLGSFGI